jgi:hypothetical protein
VPVRAVVPLFIIVILMEIRFRQIYCTDTSKTGLLAVL